MPGTALERVEDNGVVPLVPVWRLDDGAESNSLTQNAGAVFVFRGVEEGVVVRGRFWPPRSAVAVAFCLTFGRSKAPGSPPR